MTPSADGSLDLTTVFIALATALFGSQAGTQVGVYAVILLSSLGAAAWSASKLPEGPRKGKALHIVVMVGLALAVTVPVAELCAWVLAKQGLDISARWMFAPVAIVIAARPDWVVRWVRGFFERSAQPQQGGQS